MSKRKHTSGWQQHVCLGCEEPFVTLTDPGGWLGQFCLECCKDFELTTEADAAEVVVMLGLHPSETPRSDNVLNLQSFRKPEDPPKPKVDPEKVAAGVRAQVDYRLAPIDEYKKPITYVCAKNGVFEVRYSDLATVVTRPKEILGLTTEMQEGISLNLPRVPFLFLQQTISFFRGVEARQKGSSEALVQIWWDRETKQHVMHVPEQQVSGGGVRHASRFDHENEGRYFHVADIHSHGTGMGAFWSGTDNNDERSVTTERLFGVIGKVSRPIPDWKWRMRTRDGFIDLNVADVFQMPTAPVSFTVTPEELFRTIGDDKTFKDGKAQLWCPVDPFTDVAVPDEWYTQVKSYSYNGHGCSGSLVRGTTLLKGLIYINGMEYAVEGDSLAATGHTLKPKDPAALPKE